MKKSKIILIVVLVLAIILSFPAVFIYKTQYKKTEIITSSNTNDSHKLIVYEIGEPDFPFGSANCRFVLLDGNKKTNTLDFEVRNDGGWALKENFNISWKADSVEISVNGEEQEEVTYYLYFNGKTDSNE